MKRLYGSLLAILFSVALLVAVQQAIAAAAPTSTAGHAARAQGDGGHEIQATQRISIPYGFESDLALDIDGRTVHAVGLPGACTAGDDLTIAVTITQAASAVTATGTWMGTCTGEPQHWRKSVTAEGATPFVAGEAEALGLATTRNAEGEVTDTKPWTTTVELGWFGYLPAIQSAD